MDGIYGSFYYKDFSDIISAFELLLSGFYWTVNPLKVHDLILISEYDVVSGIMNMLHNMSSKLSLWKNAILQTYNIFSQGYRNAEGGG